MEILMIRSVDWEAVALMCGLLGHQKLRNVQTLTSTGLVLQPKDYFQEAPSLSVSEEVHHLRSSCKSMLLLYTQNEIFILSPAACVASHPEALKSWFPAVDSKPFEGKDAADLHWELSQSPILSTNSCTASLLSPLAHRILPLLQSSLVLVCSGCYNKYHRLGVLNNRDLFSHDSGGWESQIRVPA